jgi:membrane protease YdiL (CAAX protease family)
VIVAWLLATVVMSFAAGVGVALVAAPAAVRAAVEGERSESRLTAIAEGAVKSGPATWSMVILSQLALLACAWVACRILRQPMRQRVGLLQTGLGAGQGTIVALATVLPFALGLVAAWLVEMILPSSGEGSAGLRRMWSEGSRGESVAWILLIALLPGFVEEVFYRGFVQRGLLLRWGPTASIMLSSLLWAIVHGEPAWAAAIFIWGLWLGVVAWRTGSVLLPFAMHAGVNGLWTAGMMTLHRAPESEPVLNSIALAALVLGAVAFPWACVILRRHSAGPAEAPRRERPPAKLALRVAAAAAIAGALGFALIPAGRAPPAERAAPSVEALEAAVAAEVSCPAPDQGTEVEFFLSPGESTRIALPENRSGVGEVLVALDAEGLVVWLAYSGELSGKGVDRRPVGVLEQLAPGQPTRLALSLTEGDPPVAVRATLHESPESVAAIKARAEAEGWATRGRR